ncbi:hypothetical protein BDZ89DRAFT_122961 [Hymenopellis radicata]|nr:hypothetical protein BDZ89DRAFT_122961 [Hymenopellis radicata]
MCEVDAWTAFRTYCPVNTAVTSWMRRLDTIPPSGVRNSMGGHRHSFVLGSCDDSYALMFGSATAKLWSSWCSRSHSNAFRAKLARQRSL